jgi:diaminohydroxyphosphoribosylaminopyrimidine deaminase/5-amino-6-(5-phosphoribosylamino)uracil reductase
MTAFSRADHAHMARALVLARRGMYSTPPNPSVGCVVVSGGEVVGEGYHRRTGEAHAEVVALAAAGHRARNSTVYVTLEPCAHRGRTPPCTQALLDAGVSRVVAATADPNPHVDGGGLRRLAAAGVAVQSGLLGAEAEEINRGFMSRMRRGRPWVTLKIAASLDGRTALANGRSKWITGPAARADVQRLRARASAIVTGIGTVLADDPELTVRDPSLETLGRAPLRVLLDPDLRVPADAKLLVGGPPTLVFARSGRVARGAPGGAAYAVEPLPAGESGLDLGRLLGRLGELECNEILVEAGPSLAGSFLHSGHVDELVLYQAPTVLGDSARPMLRLGTLHEMSERFDFELRDSRTVGVDIRLTLRPLRKEPG